MVLYHLVTVEHPDYLKLAATLDHARREDEKAIVELQEFLGGCDLLRDECVLRDDLIKGYTMNAVKRLESLNALAITGKDPDKIELPIVSWNDRETNNEGETLRKDER